MSNTVIIYFTRHAESIANRNSARPHPNLKPHAFLDATLSGNGYAQVIENRAKKLEQIGKADFIFCSPLKRAIQTCLLTYNTNQIDSNIYLLPLLMEFDKTFECEGVPVPQLLSDPELLTYENSTKLNCDYFWTSNPNKTTGEWYNLDFRYNLHGRIEQFFQLLKNKEFTNKTLHVYSHAGFIGNIPGFNQNIHNYHTVKVTFNQDTNDLLTEIL
jgi:broad specificity phosphatase PhoE